MDSGEAIYWEEEGTISLPHKHTACFQKGSRQALAEQNELEGKSIKVSEPEGKTG